MDADATIRPGRGQGTRLQPLTRRTVDWDGDRDQIPRSRRRSYGPTYEAAVVAPIAGIQDLGLDVDALAASDEATREISRFDAELAGEIAPFASLLLRSESAASSQIENLTASAKSIALAEMGETGRTNANLVVANTRAMTAAIRLAENLDGAAIIEMHRELLDATSPGIVGSWRRQQVWVGGGRWGPHEAEFIAPHHDDVPAAMDDLVRFMARDDLPVLPQAALAHAQFETIHPFPDGNGRTGRALVHAMLRAKRVTTAVTVPVSAGLLVDTAAYFDALTAFRAGDPNPIVTSMADAAFASIVNARRLRAELAAARSAWNERISARRGAAVWTIADVLIERPVITSAQLQTLLGLSAPAVNNALDQLAEAGIVSNLTGRSRRRVWVAEEVIDALDAFAERAGRRG